jgi:hypothetical protein
VEAEVYINHMYYILEGSKGERRMQGSAEHTLLLNILSRKFGLR